MRIRRHRWPQMVRRWLSGPVGWLGFGLAVGLLFVPSVLSSWEPGWQRLELSAPDAPPNPTELIIEPPLLAKLRTLAAGLHAEIALCLYGTVEGDTARLDAFYMPEPTVSTASKSLVRPCPPETLAVWHNHPLEGTAAYAVRGSWRSRHARTARHLCVLSKTDIQTSMRFKHPFVIVGVDGDTWCWWTHDEIVRLSEQGTWPGLPSPERLVARDRPPALGPLAGTGDRDGIPHPLGAPR